MVGINEGALSAAEAAFGGIKVNKFYFCFKMMNNNPENIYQTGCVNVYRICKRNAEEQKLN